MKILFFTDSHEDYLADSILHGLRSIYGSDCVDYPKCEVLYKNCPEYIKKEVRGNGFTLYSGLLDDIEIDRFNIAQKIKDGFFDLIVFSNIYTQFGYFIQYRPFLNGKNAIILDGMDTSQPYPAAGFWWRRLYYWMLPSAIKDFLYFKREWTPDTHFTFAMRLLPAPIRRLLPQPKNLRKISFSIPASKISSAIPNKVKDFPKHIVDISVSKIVEGSHSNYAFDSESSYYEDLQSSKFGITVKRAGWDCLRHYEIAANGAVICFKDLDKKPKMCAPHGLSPLNTIIYKDAEDLSSQINALSKEEYTRMQMETNKWIKLNTTTEIAKRVISEWKEYTNCSLGESATF